MGRRFRLFILPLAVIGSCYFGINLSATRQEMFTRVSRALRSYSYDKKMDMIDYRRLCSGPRRRNVTGAVPYYKHKQAVYGLHVGHTSPYGRFNNHLIALFTAVDTAMSSNNHTVVIVSGWAENLLSVFFPDDQSWATLACDLPIVRDSPNLNLIPLYHTAREMFERKIYAFQERNDWTVTHTRRVAFVHYLFSSLEGPPCRMQSRIEGYLQGRFNESRYIAVHVRNMEGACSTFDELKQEQCEMNADFIKSVVEPTGLYGKLPIVLLSDMQDEEKLRNIQNETLMVVVPQWDLMVSPSVLSDIVVGGASEIFIGNHASSMSRNIGIIREGLGRHIETNFVYLNKTEEGNWTSIQFHHPYSWSWGDN